MKGPLAKTRIFVLSGIWALICTGVLSYNIYEYFYTGPLTCTADFSQKSFSCVSGNGWPRPDWTFYFLIMAIPPITALIALRFLRREELQG